MQYLNYYFKKAFLKLYDLRNESSSSAMIFLFVHSISIVFWRAESNFFFGILMHSNLYKLKFCAITLYVVAKKNEITIKVCSVSFSVQIFFPLLFFANPPFYGKVPWDFMTRHWCPTFYCTFTFVPIDVCVCA